MTKSCPKGQYYCYTDNKCKKIPKGYAIGARGYLKQEPQEDDSKNNGNGNGNGNSKSNGSSGNGGGNGNGGNGGNGGSGGVSEATDLGTLEGVKYYDGSDRNPNTGLPKGLKNGNGKSTDKPLKGVPYNILRAHYEIPVQEVQVTGMDEVINYKTFAQQAQDAREKKAKRREDGKKKDDDFMAKKKERAAKGVKFYDSKGKGYVKSGVKTYEENDLNMNEEGLRDWFGKSKSKDGKSGWVNVKTGGTCASDEPGEGTPKCVSSSKRASMSKAERESASRRKKAADPGQQSKTNAAKPTYVSTDKKKMKNEETELDRLKAILKSGMMNGKKLTPQQRQGMEAGISQGQGMSQQKEGKSYADFMAESKGRLTSSNDMQSKMYADKNKSGKKMSDDEIKKEKGGKDFLARLKVAKEKMKKEEVEVVDEKFATQYKDKSKLGQSSQRKSLGRGSSIKDGAKESGYESKKEHRDSSKKLAKYQTKGTYNAHLKKEEAVIDEMGKQYSNDGSINLDALTKAAQKMGKNIKKKFPDGKRPLYPDLDKAHYEPEGEMLEVKEIPKNVKGIAKELDKAVAMHTSQAKRLRKAGISEAKDKKGKGSGTKDACYSKVKSRYDVWPSAYASGALSKCRKVGAANWGNSSKKEGYEYADEGLVDGVKNVLTNLKTKMKQNSDARKKYNQTNPGGNITKSQHMQQIRNAGGDPSHMEGKTFTQFQQECWKTHKQQGLKKKGNRMVPNCVPKNEEAKIDEGAAWTKKSGKNKEGGLNEKGRKSYERENPGSDLKAPVTGKPKKGSKAEGRQKSFCDRMKGMRKRQKPSNNTGDDRLSKSLRKWNC